MRFLGPNCLHPLEVDFSNRPPDAVSGPLHRGHPVPFGVRIPAPQLNSLACLRGSGAVELTDTASPGRSGSLAPFAGLPGLGTTLEITRSHAVNQFKGELAISGS